MIHHLPFYPKVMKKRIKNSKNYKKNHRKCQNLQKVKEDLLISSLRTLLLSMDQLIHQEKKNLESQKI